MNRQSREDRQWDLRGRRTMKSGIHRIWRTDGFARWTSVESMRARGAGLRT
jgi:hypothetical protein